MTEISGQEFYSEREALKKVELALESGAEGATEMKADISNLIGRALSGNVCSVEMSTQGAIKLKWEKQPSAQDINQGNGWVLGPRNSRDGLHRSIPGEENVIQSGPGGGVLPGSGTTA